MKNKREHTHTHTTVSSNCIRRSLCQTSAKGAPCAPERARKAPQPSFPGKLLGSIERAEFGYLALQGSCFPPSGIIILEQVGIHG